MTKRGGRGRVGERGNHRVMRRERARPPWGVVKDARRRARGGGEWRGGRAKNSRAARQSRKNTVLGWVVVSSVNRVRLCDCRCRVLVHARARNRSRRHVPWLWRRLRRGSAGKPARGRTRGRASREAFAPSWLSRNPSMTVHPAVLRKMDLEAGQAVVRTIPVAALVPAKMLVDQAVHIVGRHAVVSPRGFFPRTQDGPVLPGPPSSSLAPRPELTPPTAPASSPGAAISRARAPEPRSAAAGAPLPRCAARRAFPPRTTRSGRYSRAFFEPPRSDLSRTKPKNVFSRRRRERQRALSRNRPNATF